MSKYNAQTLYAPILRTDFTSPAQRMLAMVLAWQQRYELRRHLLEMDDRLLEDIGMSRAAAKQEAAKPFWRE